MKTLILWAILTQGADIGTTAWGLHRGCHELVWPTQNVYLIGTTKAAAIITFAWGAPKLHKTHPRWAKGLASAIIISGAAGTAWNLSQIGSCHR